MPTKRAKHAKGTTSAASSLSEKEQLAVRGW